MSDDKRLALEVARTAIDLADGAGADPRAVADLRRMVRMIDRGPAAPRDEVALRFDVSDLDDPHDVPGTEGGPQAY